MLGFEGVDAFLQYLGFEETNQSKLICPEDQPPRSVIQMAQECCREFAEQFREKQHIFQLLSESKKDFESTTERAMANGHQRSPRDPAEAVGHDEDDDDKDGDYDIGSVNSIDSEAVTMAISAVTSNSTSSSVKTVKSPSLKKSDHENSPSLQRLRRGGHFEQTEEATSPSAERKEDDLSIERQNTEEAEQYTLRQLVWGITHESNNNMNQQTADVLLLCHGTFAESTDLLDLLIERFRGKTTLSGAALKSNHHLGDDAALELQWNRQVKVGSMRSAWMKTFWEQDFESNEALIDILEDFFHGVKEEFGANKKGLWICRDSFW